MVRNSEDALNLIKNHKCTGHILSALLKEKQKIREDKEENVSSYRMTLKRREDTGTWKRKRKIREKDAWNSLQIRRKTGYLTP